MQTSRLNQRMGGKSSTVHVGNGAGAHLEDRWGTSGGCYKCPNVGIQTRGKLCGKDVGRRHSQWETGQPACSLGNMAEQGLFTEKFSRQQETKGGQHLSRTWQKRISLLSKEGKTAPRKAKQVREKLLTGKKRWNRISLITEDGEKAAERDRGRQAGDKDGAETKS